jgi:2,4-dienoyl-CoA reductase-like NADH-dependent reductase (Old Yellow Enzyme family)
LESAGIDLIEISGGTYEAPAMMGAKRKESTIKREAYFMDFAVKARQAVKTPLVVTGGFRSFEGMAEAIQSGNVDFVGLARLIAVEPDAPLRLLNGQSPKISIQPIKTGIGPIDKMSVMETVWYREQLERMGKGKEPKPNLSAFVVFLKFAYKLIFKRKGALKERAS